MGVYYKIINPAERQFLDPVDFGEAIKWPGLLRGPHCLEALKYLISDSHRQQTTEPWQLAGSWLGDPIIISGDDSSPPNPAGIQTTSDDHPERNLNAMAEDEFYNISHLALVMLAEIGHADEIINDAENNDRLFATVAAALMQIQPPKLKRAFDARFGHAWKKRYEEIIAQHPWRQPLPITFDT